MYHSRRLNYVNECDVSLSKLSKMFVYIQPLSQTTESGNDRSYCQKCQKMVVSYDVLKTFSLIVRITEQDTYEIN